MDESWRMRMGMPSFYRRRSTELLASLNRTARQSVYANSDALDAEDFADVFGGPPRTVLGHKLTGDFTNSTSFYEEIFRQPEFDSSVPANKTGRSLRAFNIPARSNEFYSDIFGNDHDDRIRRSRDRSRTSSKGKSESNSSSVLSSEDLSPLRPVISDDVALCSFASKLRPLNVPGRWNSTTMMPAAEHPKNKQGGMPGSFPHNSPSCSENQYMDSGNKSSYNGFSSQRVTSPEIISLGPNSYRSLKVSADDLEFNSPSSAVSSSLCQDWEVKAGFRNENDRMQEQEDDDDEVMSSYVIEINSDHYREGNDEAIDEAVAWAKEKYQQQSPEKDWSTTQVKEQSAETQERANECESLDQQMINGHNSTQWTTEEKQHSEDDMELRLLDEEVDLWSSGKETNIQLLLSSLHQILWPDSGWHAVPLTNLIESSHVKKAYQKAQLCLHPDKLQQRGATIPQKYVAEKAFAILQDAWAAFVTQDVLLTRGCSNGTLWNSGLASK